MNRRVYIYLFEGFSDWEISYLTPELNNSDRFNVHYFSKDGKELRSMGGLRVTPDLALSNVDISSMDLLILPGGAAWENQQNIEMMSLVQDVAGANGTIAAICAATTFLARLGMLDKINHTSNDLTYLMTMVPTYRGESKYQNKLAVADQNVITANGVAPIEFAREIFSKIDLYDTADIEKWFRLFKYGIWEA